ncbi:hypothetical protein AALP_AAs44667U000300 [Arabis alpina]|uniref:Reverse transcriptase Ty1/copia-type domain-containing protein n=1 Tax=Arabis alpina TaxID=50452 RepID=A0A087G014_ARAAL|nr:hypothetical protein AALP_AAs44667U000300 [Arabis alpina]
MAQVPYASAVRCLMYAIVCTTPDLAQAVSQVSKYMSNPGRDHWNAVKWILRYLKGTTEYGLRFGDQKCVAVLGYVDSDYAGDLDNRRSTIGYVFTPAAGPVSWRSVLQDVVAMSTTEAEYMAMGETAKEALWIQGLVVKLSVEQGGVLLTMIARVQCIWQIIKCIVQGRSTFSKHVDQASHCGEVQALLGFAPCFPVLEEDEVPQEMNKGFEGEGEGAGDFASR